jgi:hypothetical protein
MVLLRRLVDLNGGGGATTRVRARTAVRKSGQGVGFSSSCIEPRALAHAVNHPESNLNLNQRSLEDSDMKSLSNLIFTQLHLIQF